MVTSEVQAMITNYTAERKNLMLILQQINDEKGWISKEDMQQIADYLDISPTDVYGVASFYSFFNLKEKGKYIIRICQSLTCDMIEKDNILQALESACGIQLGQTSSDKLFTLEYTNCLGMCDKGPAMMINKEMVTALTSRKISEIIAELKKGV
jgi:NADH-quinone oxidoreductase E subunit